MKDIHSPANGVCVCVSVYVCVWWGGGAPVSPAWKREYVQCSNVRYPVPCVAALWAITNVLLFQLTSASAQEDKDIQLERGSRSQHAGAG